MRSLTRNIALTIGIVAFLLSSIDIQAATPAPPPGFTYTGGLFAEYFQNAVSLDCPIEDGYILKGFSGGMNTYMRPDCAIGLWESDGTSQVWSKRNLHGFGTTNPQYTLELSGSLRLNLSGSEAANLVLMSDTNGVASWHSIPGTCIPAGGANNLCQGIGSLQKSGLSGNYNVAIGDYSLSGNTIGSSNTAIGYNSLTKNNASNNTAIGFQSLFSNTTGHHNVAIGISSLSGNTTGTENIGIGYLTLSSNISGNYNVAIGDYALSNTTRSNLVAIGHASLTNNTVGDFNTSIGTYALQFNTGGNSNSALGYFALNSNQIGNNNVAMGVNAGFKLLGSRNTLLGRSAGANLGTGGTADNDNTFIGYNAGQNQVTGNSNIVIGSNSTLLSTTGSNQLNIGGWIYGSGGDIGINTSTPTAKLDIKAGNSASLLYGASIRNTNNAAGSAIGYAFGLESTTKKGAIIFERKGGWGVGDMHFALNSSGSSQDATIMDSKMTITRTGYVGIGNTSPSYVLDVSGSIIRIKNPGGVSADIALSNNIDPNGRISYSGGDMNFFAKSSTSPKIQIGSGGNVGIGYVSPQYKLDVNGTIRGGSSVPFTWGGTFSQLKSDQGGSVELGGNNSYTGGGSPYIDFHYNGLYEDYNARIINSGNGILEYRAPTSYFNGNVGIGDSTPSYKLDVAGTGAFQSIDAGKSISFAQPNPFIQFNSGGPTISLPSANNLAISTSGVERMRVDNNGNIGIADTTPSYKLDVAGTGAFMGLRVTVGASAGKVLTSDTTGNATWQSLPSGLPIGIAGNTMYHNGTAWVASSNIYNNNGNVGIGTTTPGTKLHVNGGDISLALTAGQTPARLIGHDNATSFWYIGASNNSSFVVGDAHSWDRSVSFKYNPGTTGSAGGVLDIGQIQKNGTTYTHGITRFFTNGTEKVRIDSSGNVGIGTTSPGAKLDVNGVVNATDVAFGNGSTRTQTKDNAGASGGKSGFFETSTPTNYPAGASGWWHLIDTRHSNGANNYALQIAGSFFDQNLYFRKTNNSATQAWSRIIAQGTNGKVEIGDTSQDFLPSGSNWDYTLQLNSQDTSSIGFHDAGANVSSIRYRNKLFTIGGDDGWGIANVLVPGTITSAGFIYSSDKNLKKEISPLSDSLSKITSLNGYSFVWKKSGEKDIGVIAQEVEKVFPDLVHTDAETGMKSVEYGNLIAPVIEAIKSQQHIIEEQNTRIQSLEARLEALEAKMK